MKTLQEVEQNYNLELDKIIENIKKLKKKNPRVLLQFPDGLKPYSTAVVSELEKRTKNAEFIIFLGSCFGACDTPNIGKLEKEIDLLVSFGHTKWEFN